MCVGVCVCVCVKRESETLEETKIEAHCERER